MRVQNDNYDIWHERNAKINKMLNETYESESKTMDKYMVALCLYPFKHPSQTFFNIVSFIFNRPYIMFGLATLLLSFNYYYNALNVQDMVQPLTQEPTAIIQHQATMEMK